MSRLTGCTTTPDLPRRRLTCLKSLTQRTVVGKFRHRYLRSSKIDNRPQSDQCRHVIVVVTLRPLTTQLTTTRLSELTVTRRILVPVLAALSIAMASPAYAEVPGAQAPGRAVPVRVMTYNIQHGAGSDGVFNLDRTIAEIRAQQPDIVGLQEVDDHWGARSDFTDEPAAIARALGMSVFFAPIYDFPPSTPGGHNQQFGVAILSRYPIVHAVNHDITRLSTQDANPTPKPAPGFPEVVVDVRGALVHVFDTHLDYRADPSIRAMQVSDTLRIMRSAGGQQVLVGDLNAGYEAPELSGLWGYVTDTLAAAGQADTATWPARAPRDRNDYVTFTAPMTMSRVRVPVTLAADHLPVVADLVAVRGDNP